MEMGLSTELIELIIIIEFSLIILMIFVTYFAKFSSWLLNRRREKLKLQIEAFLLRSMNERKFNLKQVKRRYKKIQFLFPIFCKLDEEHRNNPNWLSLRGELINQLLLPLARKRARSRRWLLRLYAADIFKIVYELKDEPLLLRLLRDRIPLVYLHSIETAVKNESEAGINAIITRMAKMSWITQTMYLAPFEKATPIIREYVIKRLNVANEESVRAECYKILMKFNKQQPINWDIQADLKSTNYELRLSALKFYIYVEGDKAVPIMITMLKDPHYEIKIVALQGLVKFKVKEALGPISLCLSDLDWRVKMNAAHALKSFGSEGNNLLKNKSPELANMVVGMEEHTPGTLW